MGEFMYENEKSKTSSNNEISSCNNSSTFQIPDNRTKVLFQRKMQELNVINSNSIPTTQLQETSQKPSLPVTQKTEDLEDEELPVQGKFETTQLVEEEEELPLQGKFSTLQRIEGQEEEEPLQGKFTQQADITQLKESMPNNTGLPDNLKSGIENLSGMSLDNVNVHYNSDKPAQLHALAYTQGTDIHVASGQEQHLPHEAWHVVQQMQGRVEPTLEMNGSVPVNDDAGLENEADIMGSKAL
jgi:hypothetical protein